MNLEKSRTLLAPTLGYLCILFSLVAACLVFSGPEPVQANYDPESIIDEIPIFSARSSLSPEISGRYEAHRRSSEPDLEEVDDYDDDERQRGSSSNQHDTYENPAYGESRRAAKEGEDIENFFDRHIGPDGTDMAGAGQQAGDPDDHELTLSSANNNRNTNDLSLLGPELKGRSDDPFEMAAAASSPLATIFQTLLNAHKRPIVIETSDLSEVLASSGASAGSSSTTSTNHNDPHSSSSATSSVAGSSPTVAALGASSQSLGAISPIASFLSPIAAPSSLAAYGQHMMEQAASGMVGPVGGVIGNDQSSMTGGDDASRGTGSANSEDDSGQIQEIYIGRRPTIMSHFQSYSPSKLSQQSSNAAHWRGAPPAATMGVQSANMMMSRPSMLTNEQMSAYNSDYNRYPVAASYQQESADNGGDDDGTVEYNLSFGGGSGSGAGDSSTRGSSSGNDDGPEEMSSLSVDSQAGAADESSPDQMPASYGRMRQMSGTNQYMNSFSPYQQQHQPDQSQSQQYQQQLQNAYHHQQQQHAIGIGSSAATAAYGGRKNQSKKNNPNYPTKSGRNQQQHAQRQQQYSGARQSHASRYHKDPSESVVQPINYGQFRPHQTPAMMLMNQQKQMNNLRQRPYKQAMRKSQDYDKPRQEATEQLATMTPNERDWHERQKYLAMLDREIKNTPRYANEYSRKNVVHNGAWRNRQPDTENYSIRPSSNGVQSTRSNEDSQITKNDGNQSTDDIYSNVQSETRNPTRVFQQQQTIASSSYPSTKQISSSSSHETPIGDNSNNNNQQMTPSQSNRLSDNNHNNNINKANDNNNNNIYRNDINNGTNQHLTITVDNLASTSIESNTPKSPNSKFINPSSPSPSVAMGTELLQQQSNTDNNNQEYHQTNTNQHLSRVKRDDSDDRDDADDDGVWVEDDDDDDNSRQSSDVNETSQEPEDDSSGDQGGDESGPHSSYNVQPIAAQVAGVNLNPSVGYITRPHSYELSPDDAYGYGSYP